jgi:hypothetical protein
MWFLALFISLIGCWTSSGQKATVQNVQSKEDNYIWLSRVTNTKASVQVRWYYSESSLGIKSFEDSIGLVIGPHVVIADGWEAISDPSRGFVLEKVVILPLNKSEAADEVEMHLVASTPKRLPYTMSSDLVILATSSTLPLKPAVFARFSYDDHVVEGYRFLYTRNQGSFFDSAKAVPASVQFAFDSKTCRVDMYEWVELPDDFYGRYGNLTGFDENHRLICFGGMPAQRVRKFLEKNHVSVLSK